MTLYDYALKAFYEGSDCFGERPTEDSRETARLEKVVYGEGWTNLDTLRKPDMHYMLNIRMVQDYKGETLPCGTGIGIYHTNNGDSIFFQSGHRVFDIELTPELQAELDSAEITEF